MEAGTRPEDFQSGDIVTQLLPDNLPHIAIVPDRRSADGLRLLDLHNIGRGAVEEGTLFVFETTGQYRLTEESLTALRTLDAPSPPAGPPAAQAFLAPPPVPAPRSTRRAYGPAPSTPGRR